MYRVRILSQVGHDIIDELIVRLIAVGEPDCLGIQQVEQHDHIAVIGTQLIHRNCDCVLHRLSLPGC